MFIVLKNLFLDLYGKKNLEVIYFGYNNVGGLVIVRFGYVIYIIRRGMLIISKLIIFFYVYLL